MPPHLSSNQTNQKTPTHKKHRKTHRILTILAFSGFSWRLFWSSCASPRALAAILEPADTLCGRPQSLSDLSWAAWSPFWRPLGPSWARPGGPWRPFGGPKKISGCSFLPLRIPLPFRPPFLAPSGALFGCFRSLLGPYGAVFLIFLDSLAPSWPPHPTKSTIQKGWGGGVGPLRGVQLNSAGPLRAHAMFRTRE